MKVAVRTAGYLLLMFGLVWIIAVAGGVLSRAENWMGAKNLAIGFGFHTVCMVLGTWLAAWGARSKQLAKAA